MSDYLDPANEELLKDFFIEAQMQVDILEQNILALENDPGNRDSVDEIFRAAHTLKGGSAAVQMEEITSITHVLEDLLDEIREDRVAIDSGVVDALLSAIDVIKSMVESRASGAVYDDDFSEVEKHLHTLMTDKEPEPSSGTAGQRTPALPGRTESLSEYDILEMQEAAGDKKSIVKVSVEFNEDNPMNTVGGIQVFAALKDFGKLLRTVPDFEKLYEDIFHPHVDYYLSTENESEEIKKRLNIPDVVLSASVEKVGGEKEETIQQSRLETQEKSAEKERVQEQESQTAPKGKPEIREKKVLSKGSVLRVESGRIDNLLNLVSEAVINKAAFNQLSTQFAETYIDFQTTKVLFKEKHKELFNKLPEYLDSIQQGTPIKEIKKDITSRFGDLFTLFDNVEGEFKTSINNFKSTSQNLSRITGELHERVLQIRMVPISQIFNRFPRLVRDLSKSLSKKVHLQIEGEDTELDKSVIEDLLDPLIHCVRNSIDHGIETPENRVSEGKGEEGTILLKAGNEGNMIIIEISDDGRGIEVETIRKKAIDRGILHPNKNLSEIEAFNLIFEPGFSTAKTVTNISGRGVGLDVVKKQIEKLNGSVSVFSEAGNGTKITIKLPLTLAIIQGLLVSVGKEIYAIPITSVLESHRIKPAEIKFIDNYEVFNVREDVISLIRLNRLFRIPSDEQGEYNFVVIVGSEEKKMGLVVDSLIGEEDVVIKPLKDKYTNSPGIAGATILGSGKVSLIIDVSQLLDLGLKTELEQRRMREARIT